MGRYTVRQTTRWFGATAYAVIDQAGIDRPFVVKSLEQAAWAAYELNHQYGQIVMATIAGNDARWAGHR